MILVDTSVWVAALRRPASAEASTLRALLDADEVGLPLPVRVELMAGIARHNRSSFGHGLSALPVLRPTDDTWQIVERWIAPASDAGQHFAVTDLLIAGLAHEAGALIWSLDDDFTRMSDLGFVQLYQ